MRAVFVCLFLILIFGCEQAAQTTQTESEQEQNSTPEAAQVVSAEQTKNPQQQTAKANSDSKYTEIEWIELIPADDLEALMNPPEYLMQVEDGSLEDQISSTMKNAVTSNSNSDDIYEQALISTRIIESMNDKDIRIPGFVVPVDFDDQQKITSFFLVPFFGACIHEPPPPPNQIIYVEVEEGFEHSSIYDPVWVSGNLKTELFEDPIATSAYTMKLEHIENYEESE